MNTGRRIAAALISGLALLPATSRAEETVRIWPQPGSQWTVHLVRDDNGKLACDMLASPPGSGAFLMGIIAADDSVSVAEALYLADGGFSTHPGSTIDVRKDGKDYYSFKVTFRTPNANLGWTEAAKLDDQVHIGYGDGVFKDPGSRLTYVTGGSRYTVSLKGAAKAWPDFEKCQDILMSFEK